MERIAKLQLEAFSGGSANGYNGKFNLRLPTGTTIREIFLDLENLNIGQVKHISLQLNGDEILRTTGLKLDSLRKSLKLHTNSKTIVIPFTDVSQKLVQDQNYSELVVLPAENLKLFIETDDATAAQAAANSVATISARAHFATAPRYGVGSNGQPNGVWTRYRLPRMFDEMLSVKRTGSNKFRGLMSQNKSGNGARLQRMIMLSGKIDRFKVRRNRIEIVDISAADNKFDNTALGLLTKDNEFIFTCVDSKFTTADALKIGNSFEYELDMSAATDVETIFQGVEVYQQPAT